MRALAVLAVVAFHAFPNLIKGGFIGVDIFFVISGYLISSIIFENLEQGTFRFTEFYFRRIKRIFPALILVLASCLAVGWFILLAEEYKQLGKYTAAGAGFTANFVLLADASYFDNSAEQKPLLHLWSLSIEEQFYIVWPLLLWFAWNRKFSIPVITFCAASISFTLNLKGMNQNPVATFYSPQTRFWEILCGSLLAWFTFYNNSACKSIKPKIDDLLAAARIVRTQKNTTILFNFLSAIGLAFIVFGFIRINRSQAFPGVIALIPTIGSILIISSGPNAWVNRCILSNRIVIWFGLISFPLYLWHWPLHSFSRIIESENPSQEIRIGLILLSILLASVTYRFIEIPVRFGRRNQIITSVLFFLICIIGFIGYNIHTKNGLKFRNADRVSQINRFDDPYRDSCKIITAEFYSDDYCNKGSGLDVPLNAVVIGDSFSNAFTPMLIFYSNNFEKRFKFTQFGRGQCPSLVGYGPAYCQLITKKSFEFIKQSQTVKTIILASNWPAYYGGKSFDRVNYFEDAHSFRIALEKTIATLKESKKEVVVFLSPPTGSSPKSCIVRPFRLTDKNLCNLKLEDALSRDGEYRSYMIPLLDKLGIKYFDPFDIFCDQTECKIASKSGEIFSSDGMHLSVFGGEFLAKNGRARLETILSAF